MRKSKESVTDAIVEVVDDLSRVRLPRRAPAGQTIGADSPGQQGMSVAPTFEAEEDDTQFVSAVARAMSVLGAFRRGEGPIGNTELAERTGLTKPTVSRLTYTLARCGYLSFDQRHRVYELGPSVLALGHIAMSSVSLRQLARPLMQQLARHANFNVGLGTRDRDMMVYTDTFEGDALVGLRLFVGSRLPIISSAMGRAYLAALDPTARDALLAQLQQQNSKDWSEQLKRFNKALKEYQTYGFCTSLGEWQSDINGVATAICSTEGDRVYAVNLGGPAYLLPAKELRETLGPQVLKLARTVEASMSPP